jgi:integral membrane protein (TIGR01906 family)
MIKKNIATRGIAVLGLICFILCVLTLSITITINFRPLYLFEIQHLDILESVGMDKATLLKNYDHLMWYLNNPWQTKLAFPDFAMSVSGAFHFVEVKRLFLLCYGVLAVTIVPTIFYVRYLMINKRMWTLIRPLQWAMVIPVFLAVIMATGFDQFFTAFHGLFFNNDAWLFNPATDPIINALPETYFFHCFILFFILLEGSFFLGILFGKRELKKV